MIDKSVINRLREEKDFSDIEFSTVLNTDKYDSLLFSEADSVRRENYGDKVYIRGLIEITNYCKNNCFYCGIRAENKNVCRYRLTKEQILSCCDEGYSLGFRTFVLQGGEDAFFTDKVVCDIVSEIKEKHSDCAVTLSLGERTKESYKAFYNAGADRYLLRHETANSEHYAKLHPEKMTLKTRKKCLFDLKEIGYQVGAGFMVGSPFQTTENILEDIRFLQELMPDMIGIGPFVAHSGTPFGTFENGSVALTLRIIAVLRLLFPYALIPATTALGTLSENGREQGLKAGANVVMPNLSPKEVRNLYEIYENKLAFGAESAKEIEMLKKRVKEAGYTVVTDIGNVKGL